MKIVLLIVGWVLYFTFHSLLADSQLKEKMKKRLKDKYNYYRLAYVFVSSAGLLFLLFWNANIKSIDFVDPSGWMRYLSLMFAAFGVIIIKLAFKSYDFSSFIGVTQEENSPLITKGILGSIRHPIYSGTILIVIGYWFFSPDLPTSISALCVFTYLPIGIYLEEKKLITEYGDQYVKYKEKVPAIFPRLR